MAYYALLDQNNIVVQVISGKDEGGEIDWEAYYSNFTGKNCKRTSYNSCCGEHLTGKECFRKNFAGIGFTYDKYRDAFIPPKPYNSWVLDQQTCTWKAPIDRPNDENTYIWNENTLSWEIE